MDYRERRSPRGERGLKLCWNRCSIELDLCRSPRGERGLKHAQVGPDLDLLQSLPTRGAWIETPYRQRLRMGGLSLPTRGAWIETFTYNDNHTHAESLPTRGAWIETSFSPKAVWYGSSRSPRGERGLKQMPAGADTAVWESLPTRGAWIETRKLPPFFISRRSLPTRGAWIETHLCRWANH